MREPLRAAIIGLFAVVAIAVLAAGLETTTLIGDPGEGEPGRGTGAGVTGGGVTSGPGEAVAIPYLPTLVSILIVVAVIMFVAITFVYWREALLLLLSVLLFVGVVLVLHWVFVGPDSSFLPPLIEPVTDPGGAGGGDGTDTVAPPAMVVLLLVGVGLLVAVALHTLVRRDPSIPAGSGEDAGPDTKRADAVGAAAGRAADRLASGTDVENEVFRAWRDMTALLDVTNPETSTPGEFAQAAVASGIDEADVETLTRLFEDVRYGETAATSTYEDQALETFRRIEARYGGDSDE